VRDEEEDIAFAKAVSDGITQGLPAVQQEPLLELVSKGEIMLMLDASADATAMPWDATLQITMTNTPGETGRTIPSIAGVFGQFHEGVTIVALLGQAFPADGCSTLNSHVNGKIALLARGGCTFVVKIYNAMLAGAKAVVVYNNVPSEDALSMGSDPEHATEENAINIPSTMVTYEEGMRIAKQISLGVTLSLQLSPAPVHEEGSVRNTLPEKESSVTKAAVEAAAPVDTANTENVGDENNIEGNSGGMVEDSSDVDLDEEETHPETYQHVEPVMGPEAERSQKSNLQDDTHAQHGSVGGDLAKEEIERLVATLDTAKLEAVEEEMRNLRAEAKSVRRGGKPEVVKLNSKQAKEDYMKSNYPHLSSLSKKQRINLFAKAVAGGIKQDGDEDILRWMTEF